QQELDILGQKIPLPPGAVEVEKSMSRGSNARIVIYNIDEPPALVVEYYRQFFSNNQFMVIGGQDAGGYNVSVKKDKVMFTLRISPSGQNSLLQFIW
ncbi:MAG: hypothetical protein KKE64_07030, partial [Candidatus Omnitrophica bacterium]|nr:hypothetical protein [Candidatus Omnitrophota bacterium]